MFGNNKTVKHKAFDDVRLLNGHRWDNFILREWEKKADLVVNSRKVAAEVKKLDKNSHFPKWVRIYAHDTVEFRIGGELEFSCPIIHIYPN